MQTFTGYEYLLIDAANQYGHDKWTFDDRLQWAHDNINDLEKLAEGHDWKEKPLYIKAVMAIRKAQAGEPTGHLVGFDAICSGMQIMSTITGCLSGATATGLVNPNVRADAYTECTSLVQKRIPTFQATERKKIKPAVMTTLYGSKKEPENLFGKGTAELNAFYEALYEMAPGACELLQVLVESWNPTTLMHSWKLPDGFDARVKVLNKVETRIEIDELNHSTFSYEYYDNVPLEKSVANAANVVQSIDAYIVRCIERRCNYDPFALGKAFTLLMNESIRREMKGRVPVQPASTPKFHYYVEQYKRSGMADVVILPHLTRQNISLLDDVHLDKLFTMVETMTGYKPFPVITVHDEFKCHPNNMNVLRMQYRNIMADLADSELLSDLVSQLYGTKKVLKKFTPNLSHKILKSNYALS